MSSRSTCSLYLISKPLGNEVPQGIILLLIIIIIKIIKVMKPDKYKELSSTSLCLFGLQNPGSVQQRRFDLPFGPRTNTRHRNRFFDLSRWRYNVLMRWPSGALSPTRRQFTLYT